METIKILGTGCANCLALEKNVKLALEKAWIQANVEKVTDMSDIMSYNIMSLPWLVFDEKLVSYWKVADIDEIMALIEWD